MKKLVVLLVTICAVGWFREPIIKNIGLVQAPPVPVSVLLPKSNFIVPDPAPVPIAANKPADCMSISTYAQQANSDPNAYNKLLNCNQTEEERTEFDKLMNFFSRLKYE